MTRFSLGADPSTPLTEPTFCILASLTEPRHGYAIMQWAAEVTGNRVKLGPGTLYGALGSLQDRGLIEPVADGSDGGDRRKTFVLTAKGRVLLEAETVRLESIAHIGRVAIGN